MAKAGEIMFFEEYMAPNNYHFSPSELYQFIAEQIKPNSSILNIGYSNPEILKHIIEKTNAKITSIDILDRLSYLGNRLKKSNNLEYITADVRETDFQNKQFDYTICLSVINFLGETIPQAINEMNRISKKSFVSFDEADIRFNDFNLKYFESQRIYKGNGVTSFLYIKEGIKSLFNNLNIENSMTLKSFNKFCGTRLSVLRKYIITF